MTFSFPFEPPENALEPAEMRLLDARVEPWPDQRRVRILITITPFTRRPNLYAEIRDPQGASVCSAHVIETMEERLVFTLHLRGEPTPGVYTLDLRLFYDDLGEVDQRQADFQLDAAN